MSESIVLSIVTVEDFANAVEVLLCIVDSWAPRQAFLDNFRFCQQSTD